MIRIYPHVVLSKHPDFYNIIHSQLVAMLGHRLSRGTVRIFNGGMEGAVEMTPEVVSEIENDLREILKNVQRVSERRVKRNARAPQPKDTRVDELLDGYEESVRVFAKWIRSVGFAE